MTEVTVDLDDLERLVYAASVVKPIEGALETFKRDPFVMSKMPFTEAQKRMEAAVRQARRRESGVQTVIDPDAPLTKAEADVLLHEFILPELKRIKIEADKKKPQGTAAMSIYDQLAVKGCVRIGNVIAGVAWPGDEHPELKIMPAFVVEITQRGFVEAKAFRGTQK